MKTWRTLAGYSATPISGSRKLSTGAYQNALAERINGILKTELLLSSTENLEQARKMVDEAVRIYNTEQPHMALKNKTPDAVRRAF